MVINLQFFGGRGGQSGMSGSSGVIDRSAKEKQSKLFTEKHAGTPLGIIKAIF